MTFDMSGSGAVIGVGQPWTWTDVEGRTLKSRELARWNNTAGHT